VKNLININGKVLRCLSCSPNTTHEDVYSIGNTFRYRHLSQHRK